jgi:hypothetical protein
MSPDERLAAAVRALRETPEASPSEVAQTQRRVLASLVAQRASPVRRRPWLAAAAAAMALLGSTVWAARAGLIEVPPWLDVVLRRPPAARPAQSALPTEPLPAPPRPGSEAEAPSTAPSSMADAGGPFDRAPAGTSTRHRRASIPEPTSPPRAAVDGPRDSAPGTAPPALDPWPPAPTAVGAAEGPAEPMTSSTDELYARGHRAHFVARDPNAALAAWDEYLEVAPDGRFAPEARFNRAIDLVRLGRTAEAIAALEALTHGTYRASDAARLLDAVRRGAIRTEPQP